VQSDLKNIISLKSHFFGQYPCKREFFMMKMFLFLKTVKNKPKIEIVLSKNWKNVCIMKINVFIFMLNRTKAGENFDLFSLL